MGEIKMRYKVGYSQLERIVKGVASHRRLQMLELINNEPELSLDQIVDKLKINYKTGGEHLRRLATSGLVLKRSEGNSVRHKISPRAESMLKCLRTLE